MTRAGVSASSTSGGLLALLGPVPGLGPLVGVQDDLAQPDVGRRHLEAFVAADERLTHGAVLTVVDSLRLLGVGDVGINTKPMEIE